MESDYKVKLEVFEGPLDLLLYLIKKEEVDIYDIPIERITNQYMEYLTLMQMLNLEVAGEFLVMAATLMYIKSRMLLPADQQVTDTEAEEGEDPRWELIRQLVEYKKFKDAALQLGQREEEQSNIFARRGDVGIEVDAGNAAGRGQYFRSDQRVQRRAEEGQRPRGLPRDRGGKIHSQRQNRGNPLYSARPNGDDFQRAVCEGQRRGRRWS